jgi:hypothetical protein
MAGGGKGAGIGVLAGAAGGTAVAASKKGEQLSIPSETLLEFRLQQPASLPISRRIDYFKYRRSGFRFCTTVILFRISFLLAIPSDRDSGEKIERSQCGAGCFCRRRFTGDVVSL